MVICLEGWRDGEIPKPYLRQHCLFCQMVSLLHLADITEEGVTFQSPVDGSRMLLTPEESITIQNQLGADIMMQLDDVVPATNTGRMWWQLWRLVRDDALMMQMSKGVSLYFQQLVAEAVEIVAA